MSFYMDEYHKSIRQLDRLHYNSLSNKGKQMYRIQQDGEPSTKLQPSDTPDFVIGVSGDDDQLNSSVNSED